MRDARKLETNDRSWSEMSMHKYSEKGRKNWYEKDTYEIAQEDDENLNKSENCLYGNYEQITLHNTMGTDNIWESIEEFN